MHGLDKVAHVSHVAGPASVCGIGRPAFPAVDSYFAPGPASLGWAEGSSPSALDCLLSPPSSVYGYLAPGSASLFRLGTRQQGRTTITTGLLPSWQQVSFLRDRPQACHWHGVQITANHTNGTLAACTGQPRALLAFGPCLGNTFCEACQYRQCK